MSIPKTKTPLVYPEHWSRITIYSMILNALQDAGVYRRASDAGWPVGIDVVGDYELGLTKVIVTIGVGPSTIILGTAFRKNDESIKPPLDALLDQVIGQLYILL